MASDNLQISYIYSQEHPAASNLPSTNTNVPEIAKATLQDDKPVIIQKPNASKRILPSVNETKAFEKKDVKLVFYLNAGPEL